MKCPICIEEGEKSRVTEGGGSSTLMGYSPFYDEDGKRHSHDGNTTSYEFRCNRGHSFQTSRKGSSCWCGWGKDTKKTVYAYDGENGRDITDERILKEMGVR
jgi:hypothetical protein